MSIQRTINNSRNGCGEFSSGIVGQRPKIAAIGGGTGLSTLLQGLKCFSKNITAIVTVADNGGGSGQLRRELGMLPPGDIRNCIVALANAETSMTDIMNYRFTSGCFEGQSFGNLFIAALNGLYGSFEAAVERMNQVLAVSGKVVPVTTADVNIRAEFDDGNIVTGETEICSYKKSYGRRIQNVRLIPSMPPPVKSAIDAIKEADLVILGPGSLYTSVIPNLMVDGVAKALETTDALRIYIMNVMTQDGETEDYSAREHIEALIKHAGGRKIIDICLSNSKILDKNILKRYKQEGAEQILVGKNELDKFNIISVSDDIVSDTGDFARHSPNKLANAIRDIYYKYSRTFCFKG